MTAPMIDYKIHWLKMMSVPESQAVVGRHDGINGRDNTGQRDSNGWPVKVIGPPSEAIREIYGGANTRDSDVERAVQVARGENKSRLFVGHVSSHAFRIQKGGGTNY